jgi:phosphopantothenoylcysteine decarboxylase / phosphopantothenate---cysteine ligase
MTESPDEPDVAGRKIVFCITGGIAAYKVVAVVRTLAQLGADVRVAMTRSARLFVGEQTVTALSGNPVVTDLYGTGPDVPHVELARGAELCLVAPATANIIAKLAGGFADDIVSATLLTVRCPIVVAPAMHTEMWEHPATKANLDAVSERGVTIVGPASGPLSSGDEGPGRLVEPDELVASALEQLGRASDLSGRRVLVTAGGTQEPIDPVRFVGNRSSGRMGYAIARAALRRGAKVTLISGPTELPSPPGVDLVPVQTAAEMRDAVLARAPGTDIIVKAAAVADFRPESATERKLKKASGPPEIVLVANADILHELGHTPSLRKPGGVLVGFAAETEVDPVRLAHVAEDKRAAKGADIIVANDVSSPDSGFSVRTNRAVIAGPDGTTDVGLVTKEELATAVLDRAVAALQE